ncbi:shikimate dehydrogenase [Kordiimonas pumila]|uniref:Shikimate dehydrogenase (NADP(+)) n=1 Tax=Kordiimonas pumila TaxID=2161677 RepID=A0ABV7DA13_9PROT|nr:shikimate dehydrogenase [Kordiimonas pumila]
MMIKQEKAAVIGHPISQSLSPLIHNHWMEQKGIDGCYEAHDVPVGGLEAFIEKAKAAGLSGFNVTVPHKTDILPFMDKVAPLARQMGAVNTVRIEADGTLTGFNTDGIGLITHLRNTVPGWPRDLPALILGAGGAARAAVLGLLNESLPVLMITNRTREKAEIIAKEVGRGRLTVVDWEDRHGAVAASGLVINTTTLGMVGQPELELDLALATRDTVIYDIVYKPLETGLLKAARQRSLRTVDGLGMLVHQGAAAFKVWFGHDVGFDEALRKKLETMI